MSECMVTCEWQLRGCHTIKSGHVVWHEHRTFNYTLITNGFYLFLHILNFDFMHAMCICGIDFKRIYVLGFFTFSTPII